MATGSMRVCCGNGRLRTVFPCLLAGAVALAAISGAWAATPVPAPEPPSEKNFDAFRRPTWDATVKAAYPDRVQPSLWLLRKLAAYFPDDRARIADLALTIVRTGRVPNTDQFDAIRLALAARPPEKEEANLRLELAKLYAAYTCPSIACDLLKGLESGTLFDEPTRKTLPALLEAVRFNSEDILALGRSYEAERLMREADDLVKRKEYREAATRLIKVALKYPSGYLPLAPEEGNRDPALPECGIIVGTGAQARALLAGLASEHPKDVSAAAEIESPGLSRQAESGDRAALELLANVYSFTQAGWRALLTLGEEDLDANRPALAELRFRAAWQLAPDTAAKADALCRLALARIRCGDPAGAEQALNALTALGDVQVRLGVKAIAAANAVTMLRRELADAALPPRPSVRLPIPASAPESLSPRLIFTYHPALFDLKNRTAHWPRFWARPEPLPSIDGDRVFFHDAANAWAVDWMRGTLLWHYRSPGHLYEVNHYARGYSNVSSEAAQTGRSYRVAVYPVGSGKVLCARFRRADGALTYDLRALSADDGRLLWTTQSSPALSDLSFASDPVWAADRLYAVACTTVHISTAYVVCMDAASGRVVFKTQVGSNVDTFNWTPGNFFSAHGGLTVHGGRVYLATDRGASVGLSALDGSLEWISPSDRIYQKREYWNTPVGGVRADYGSMVERSHAAPVVGASSACFLSKDAPGLFALDLATGRRRFVELPRTAVEALGEQDGLMIAAGRDGLFALRADTGTVAWEFPLPLSPRSPWRSGFAQDGLVFWPAGGEIVVLAAKTGQVVGRWRVDNPEPVTSIRPLPSGELAAFCSDGTVDRFIVLARGVSAEGRPVRLAEEAANGRVDVTTLSTQESPPDVAVPPALNPPPAQRPPPLPPLQLLWRARFSHEELFTGQYIARVVGDPPRLLAAAGDDLRCYRFDTVGDLLWRAPTPPAPQDVKLFRDGRVCLRWTHGFEVYELSTGRRVWGWSSASTVSRQGIGAEIVDACEGGKIVAVCANHMVSGISAPDGRTLWEHGVVNNAWGNRVASMAGGILLTVWQDTRYGARSYLELLDEQTGKATWKFDLPKNTYSMLGDGETVWTRSADNSRISMVTVARDGAQEAWVRDVGASKQVILDGDRIFVVKPDQVMALDSRTGRDAFPPAAATDRCFTPGPNLLTFVTPNIEYTQHFVNALDRARGTLLWTVRIPEDCPPRSTPDQVLCFDRASYGYPNYYWNNMISGHLATMISLDAATGRRLGRISIPGRNLWDAFYGGGRRAIETRDNLLLIRSEQGPVVLGTAALRPAGAVRDMFGRLSVSPTPATGRLAETFREDLMRHHPPQLGCEKADRAPVIDGEFDDWAGAAWTTLDRPSDWIPADGGALAPSRKRWAGPDDCSARFAVRHDGQMLYLVVEVRDDDFCPPVSTGLESPGDSVEVGLSLYQGRDDALQVEHGRHHPDIKVVLALIDNRPVAVPVWNGQGAEAAVSVRPGLVRYEAAIRFQSSYIGPLIPNQVGLALQVNDADGGRPKGAMRWAGGLGPINANAQFGRLILAPLSAAEAAQRRPVIDLLNDAAVGWDQMHQILLCRLAMGDSAAAAREAAGFLERHPASYHASRALAWHEQMLRSSGDGAAAENTVELARRLKVPAIEQAQAGKRLFVRVRMPAGRHPQAVGLRFTFTGGPWYRHYDRGVYWGENLGLLLDNALYVGPLPDGDNVELSFPADLLDMINRPLDSVTFMTLDGTAYWGELGVADASGKRTVWVPDDAKPPGKVDGGANWSNCPAPDGTPSHSADYPSQLWTEHTFAPVRNDGLMDADAEMEAARGRLDRKKCLEAAWLMPDNRLAFDLIVATDDVAEAARFVRQFPASPLVPDALIWIAASRAGNPALADRIVAEGRVPRQSARNFYARLLPGVAPWQVIGPFSNEADVAQRRVYEPEQRVELAGTYRGGETELRWKPGQAEADGYVNLARVIESGEYQAAYAVTWVRSAQDQRGWLFVESPNVVSAWLDSQRVMENVTGESPGRRGGAVEPVPVTLKAGWNRLLLKVCNRYGYWGFRARLGNADGSKLPDLECSNEQHGGTE